LRDNNPAALTFDATSGAQSLFGYKGYGADWFRQALTARRVESCVPPKPNRNTDAPLDKALHDGRHKIENTFGGLNGLVQHLQPLLPPRSCLHVSNRRSSCLLINQRVLSLNQVHMIR
jgi:hypothetical protein